MAAFLANIGRGIKKSVSGTSGFFRGSVQELKKVRWPNRQEMVNYTMVVVLTVLVLALFFFIIDQGILQLVRLITK
ncbi:preprotein translocase subunit SecE [Laceyella sacchari]|uniref:Protein translocase subunit SecE n=1 Tax=Laceyella sacchari TaxID=37482 RepID=A0ABY5U3T8_LACSH|nr:preprotein translocase subunit SecE [Laceyella sacchari]KPC77587.1 preprotein translocase subunit SecE [Thermoactinomyces vulgaris]TCW36664.1 protein translocase subunit secE/sec61 gamma [Laceyella sacchari]UWE03844.1 preprotein translocase subunit SecE [Laceyella sacchari]